MENAQSSLFRIENENKNKPKLETTQLPNDNR